MTPSEYVKKELDHAGIVTGTAGETEWFKSGFYMLAGMVLGLDRQIDCGVHVENSVIGFAPDVPQLKSDNASRARAPVCCGKPQSPVPSLITDVSTWGQWKCSKCGKQTTHI